MPAKLRGSLPCGPVATRDNVQFYVRRVTHAARQHMVSIPPDLAKQIGFIPGTPVTLWWDGKELHIRHLIGDDPRETEAA